MPAKKHGYASPHNVEPRPLLLNHPRAPLCKGARPLIPIPHIQLIIITVLLTRRPPPFLDRVRSSSPDVTIVGTHEYMKKSSRQMEQGRECEEVRNKCE